MCIWSMQREHRVQTNSTSLDSLLSWEVDTMSVYAYLTYWRCQELSEFHAGHGIGIGAE